MDTKGNDAYLKHLAEEQFKKPFPECARGCSIVEIFGAGECASACPEKFENGEPNQ